MSQAARIEKFEKITLGRPPDQPLPAKTLIGPPRAINLGGNPWILDFWPKVRLRSESEESIKFALYAESILPIVF